MPVHIHSSTPPQGCRDQSRWARSPGHQTELGPSALTGLCGSEALTPSLVLIFFIPSSPKWVSENTASHSGLPQLTEHGVPKRLRAPLAYQPAVESLCRGHFPLARLGAPPWSSGPSSTASLLLPSPAPQAQEVPPACGF